MLNRRGFSVAVLGGASLAFPALALQARPERTRVTIAVAGKASIYHLPLTVAEQRGYFRAEGLDVDIMDCTGASRALQAMATGTADVVSGAYEQTISQQLRGQSLQAFVLQGRTPQIAIGVSTRNLPNYQGMVDLRGKKIGVSAPGAATNMAVSMMLARAGLSPDEVSFIGVGTSAGALASVRSGQIDAISNMDPVMTQLEQQGELRIISDTRTLQGSLAVFGGPMPAACLLAPQEFVAKTPLVCQSLANGVVLALRWLRSAGHADLLKTVPESHFLGDRALYLASFIKAREAIALDGLIPSEGPDTALRVLTRCDPTLRADKVELARTYTNEFARRAKDRYGV